MCVFVCARTGEQLFWPVQRHGRQSLASCLARPSLLPRRRCAQAADLRPVSNVTWVGVDALAGEHVHLKWEVVWKQPEWQALTA